MILALQIGGGTIVALALFQLCLGVYSSVATVFRERRLDARHLQHFNDLAQAALRNAEVDRLKSGTTWAGKRKFRIVEKRVECIACILQAVAKLARRPSVSHCIEEQVVSLKPAGCAERGRRTVRTLFRLLATARQVIGRQ